MDVHRHPRTNFASLLLLFVVPAAFSAARGVNQLLGAALSPDASDRAVAIAARHSTEEAALVDTHSTRASAAPLAHNPFDSATPQLGDARERDDDGRESLPTEPGDDPPCDGVKVLVISRKGPHEYDVDRRVLETFLENEVDLLRTVSVRPETGSDGKVGLKLGALRAGTVLDRLGLESGDRIEQINGYEVGTPEKALEAYARLRVADQLVLQVARKGVTVNLEYSVNP